LARWIRTFFTDTLVALADKTMLLDWQHLKQKCYDLSSRVCRGKQAKAQFLRRLYRRLSCACMRITTQARSPVWCWSIQRMRINLSA
jgi:hypothetical protein